MDSVHDLTVVLKLLLGQTLDVVVIDSRLDQAVGVLTEMRVHLSQPVGHVVRIAGGVVGIGLQHAQVSQKSAGGDETPWGGLTLLRLPWLLYLSPLPSESCRHAQISAQILVRDV